MRKTLFVFAAFGALLMACGTKQLNSVNPKIAAKDTPQVGGTCPTIAPDAYHTVTITMPHALPGRIAMKFPADPDFRLTGCPGTQPKQTGPLVSLTPVNTPPNTLVLTVRHNYGWVQNGVFDPPVDQDFELYATMCDGTAPILYYRPPVAVPLKWKVTHPNGAACAEQDVGTGSISPTGLEAESPEIND